MTADEPPKRALVVNTAFLGDVVFTLPLLENLGRAGYEVDLLARPPFGALAVGVPGLREVVDYDKRGRDRGPRALWRLGRALRSRGYELVLAAHPSLRTRLLVRVVGAPSVGWGPGYTRSVRRGPRFVEDALELAQVAGIDTPVTRPSVRTAAAIPEIPAGAVALVPGARWATKRWPGRLS